MLIFDKNRQGGWEEMSAEAIEDTHIFLFGAHGVVSSTNQKLASPIYLDEFPGARGNRVGNQSRDGQACLSSPCIRTVVFNFSSLIDCCKPVSWDSAQNNAISRQFCIQLKN